MPLEPKDLFTTSVNRYRANVVERRLYGGSTVTQFIVGVKGSAPKEWTHIVGFGRTPGERATDAKKRYLIGERNKW